MDEKHCITGRMPTPDLDYLQNKMDLKHLIIMYTDLLTLVVILSFNLFFDPFLLSS